MSKDKTKSPSATTVTHEWWIVRGNWLPNGVKMAGPFSSDIDANRARVGMEKLAAGETFYIDSETRPAALILEGDDK